MRVTPKDIRPDFTFHIFIDGKEVIDCVMADDDKNEVEIFERVDGKFAIVGGEIQKLMLTGKVKIEKRRRPRARDYGAMNA